MCLPSATSPPAMNRYSSLIRLSLFCSLKASSHFQIVFALPVAKIFLLHILQFQKHYYHQAFHKFYIWNWWKMQQKKEVSGRCWQLLLSLLTKIAIVLSTVVELQKKQIFAILSQASNITFSFKLYILCNQSYAKMSKIITVTLIRHNKFHFVYKKLCF